MKKSALFSQIFWHSVNSHKSYNLADIIIHSSNMNILIEKPETVADLPDLDALECARVLLYNDDWHTFDEVIDQLIIAIRCSEKTAEKMAWTVHTKGVCQVFEGNLEKCFEVSAVLEEIELKTEVSF